MVNVTLSRLTNTATKFNNDKKSSNNQTIMEGTFYIEDCYLSEAAREIYPNIINNPRISQDIKDEWLEVCVNTVDIDVLCCW